MTCSNEINIRPNEILVDEWGGEVQLIEVASNLNSMFVNVKTPWGSTDSFVKINKGTYETYTSGEKKYDVYCVNVGEVNGEYYARLKLCYEFVEKINTVTSMIFDESASQTIEGEKLFFDVLLKDANNNILKYYDVDIYINNIYITNVPGDWRYEHIVTAEDIGETLTFQAKFDGTAGLNSSQSTPVSVTIPGKIGTSLSINADKTNVVIGETVSFTGTLKDENNNVLPNQGTIYLVYKKTDGTYGYVLDGTGYKVISSTDSSGNYYRPWKTIENYLDIDTYAMWYEGDDVYSSTYSPDITFNITVDECTQNIKIQDQNYNPVAGVSVVMNGVTKTTDSNGLVSFSNITRNTEYTINKSYCDYSGEDVIVGCKLDPQILYVVIPDEPVCADYKTQTECEANNCYWWTSDNSCQSAPDGTTEYFDVYIKPYSFYDGKYETAVAGTLALLAKLTGAVANYMSSVTGYEYKGLDILEEASKQLIVVRVYLKDTSETALVAPIVIGAVAGIIAGILLLAIGYVTGTSENEYSKEEVIELIDNVSDKAIEECKVRYPNRTTDVNEAASFKHCVGGIETVRVIGGADVVEENYSEYVDFTINPVIVELDNQLDDGTLLPENIDVAINDNLTVPTKEVVDDYKQQAVDEDCAWMIADTCIITKKALKTLTWGAIGIGGLFVVSTVKDIAKK